MNGILVDTNILIYAYDQTEGMKRDKAIGLLDSLKSGQRFTTVQVLGEFFVTVTRKIPRRLTASEAEAVVRRYLRTWRVLDLTPRAIVEALRGVQQFQLHYYDSLIWSTARLNQLPTILTEDGQHDRVIEGVRYLNPFHPEFDLAQAGV